MLETDSRSKSVTKNDSTQMENGSRPTFSDGGYEGYIGLYSLIDLLRRIRCLFESRPTSGH